MGGGSEVFEQLFGSKTRVKLLQLFFTNPNRAFYVREITRKIDEQINSVRRELANLLSIGLITSESNNNRLYYEVNQDYEHYGPLVTIFGGMAEAQASSDDGKAPAKKAKAKPAAAVEHPLGKAVRTIGKVDLVLLTGQFTRDDSAGIDILLVGDINQTKADKFIAELEQTENKELRYSVLTTTNYRYRLQIHDRFITGVLGAKKQVIINTQDLPTENF